MLRCLIGAVRRPLAMLSGGLLAASVVLGAPTPAVGQELPAHWGLYEWFGGQEKADVRAFWLVDRTGDPTLNWIISTVAGAWNQARAAYPELPFIAVFKDSANAGRCFVNDTPGYSIASACVMPSLRAFGLVSISATSGSPHFHGGAFAVTDGLSFEESFTVVCHNVGSLLGIPDSDDAESCMNPELDLAPGQVKWYTSGDTDAVLDLYAHDDGEPAVAVADTYSTTEDVPLVVTAPGVLANDTDAHGAALSATKVSDPAHGAVTLGADGTFTYTPNANFNGTDSFTYKAIGSGGESNVATVTITVTPVPDVPVGVADSYTTTEDTVLTVNAPGVLGNDTDPEGGLSAVELSGPAHGDLTLNTDGSFTYTPDANFNGTDSFTYKANDGVADSNAATVTITVSAVNDVPVAVNDTYAATEAVPLVVTAPGVLGNDTDVEGSAVTAVKMSDPSHGSVSLSSDGSFVYTPNVGFSGTDTFTYRANDGTANSNVATVTINVAAVVPAGS